MPDSTLASRIQQARTTAQLTVMEVSRLIAVKPETYKRWESGSSEPRVNKLATLAGVLGVSPGWLLSSEEMPMGELSAAEQVVLFRQRIEQLTAVQTRMQVMLDELSCDLDDYSNTENELTV